VFFETNRQDLLTPLRKRTKVIKHILKIAWLTAYPASHHNQEIETGGDVVLLGNMTNTRAYIRLLRRLGVALIFAPEPFTTPAGVACILVARYLSKRHEAGLNDRLRETVQYSLAHTSHPNEYVAGESGLPDPMKRRSLNEERPILGQITGGRSIAESSIRRGRFRTQQGAANRTTDMGSLSRRYRYGNSVPTTSTGTQRVIHHTIDIDWLSRRYESANGAVAHSSWATTTSGGTEGVTHHSISMGLLSQHYDTGSVGQAKAQFHAVNTAQRQRRHDSGVSPATIARALHNNSFNYDIVSKRNVIGGY